MIVDSSALVEIALGKAGAEVLMMALERGVPLLFVEDDFLRTDIATALDADTG